MSGDIVERLRLLWTEPIDDVALYETINATADEIERLWAAGDEMADAATRQQWSRLDVAVAAWQEARRG